MTTTGQSVLATVLAAQALRGLGYGLAAVQLGAVLRGQGLDAPGVGLVLAAVVAGSAAASLALGRWGDRLGRARSYGLLYGALTAAGVLIAAGAPARPTSARVPPSSRWSAGRAPSRAPAAPARVATAL